MLIWHKSGISLKEEKLPLQGTKNGSSIKNDPYRHFGLGKSGLRPQKKKKKFDVACTRHLPL